MHSKRAQELVRTWRIRKAMDSHLVEDIFLTISNDGRLYRSMTQNIIKNQAQKMAKGQWDRALAIKGFSYLTEAGIKSYIKDFGPISVSKIEKDVISAKLLDYYMDHIEEMSTELGGGVRVASFDLVAAGKAYMIELGLTREAVKKGEAAMLYKIDSGRNQSKYYEMLIIKNPQNKSGYTLIKRWGRLGPRFQERREDFKNLAGAKAELEDTQKSKTGRGYISAYGDYHLSPSKSKLPQGQYPVGLETHAGAWANQEIQSCKPVLMTLKKKLTEAVLDVENDELGRDLISDLEDAYGMTEGLSESMAEQVREKLRRPLERLRGKNKRFQKDPVKISKELKALKRYLTLQLSLCEEK